MREIHCTYKTSEKKTKLFLEIIYNTLRKRVITIKQSFMGICSKPNSSGNFSIERLSWCH